ncbi:flippase [Ruminococcus sp.]|uniref:flippase n=1 Tax=Ruminococcus sp. TaxID=41978 RepID=UPI0025F6634D|nr:flippase [Ruminococcus sp.]MCI5816463.1 flippase [Ruminococcus sp.]MDD7555365.1 flippase [Ruminococcus sp.]MDY4962988.1 flippase [Ruminococcus callidus]
MGKTKRNLIYQTLYQMLTLVLPFVTAPYISRVLGSENTGIYSYTYTTVNYFMLAALLGIETYGTRTISRVRNNQEELNKAFSSLFYCHVFVAGLCLIVYMVYALFFSGVYRVYAIIQALYILAELLNINWFFFGIEEFKITVTRNLVIKVLTIASIFLFVKDKNDLIVYITIMALGTFISQSFVWIFLRKYIKFVKASLSEIFSHLKPMSVLFISVIATSIYRMVSKSMLGAMGELSSLGCFEYADKIIRMPLSIITAIGLVMLSKTSNMYVNNNKGAVSLVGKSMEAVLIFASAIAFGLCGIADNFAVLFFGSEYAYTGNLIEAMSISLIFMSWNNVLRTQYLMPKCKDKEYVIAVWAGAVVNVLSNLIFIRLWGATGAALTTSLSYFVVSLVQAYYVKKELPVLEYLKKSAVPFAAGIVMLLCVKCIGYALDCSWISLFLQVLAGGIIYMTIVLIYLKKTNSYIYAGLVEPFIKKIRTGK